MAVTSSRSAGRERSRNRWKGLGRWRTCQPDRREPVAIGDGARSLIADRPRHYRRGDQRREPRRFRGDEPGDRAAPLAPRDRPDIPLCRGQGSLPPFRGPRPFRQSRDHARLIVGGWGSTASDRCRTSALPRCRRLMQRLMQESPTTR